MKKKFFIILVFILILTFFLGSFVLIKREENLKNFIKEKLNFFSGKLQKPISLFKSLVKKVINFLKQPLKLGWEFKGGTQLIFKPDLEENKITKDIMDGLKYIIEQRFEIYKKEAEIIEEKKYLVFTFSLDEDIEMIEEIIKQVPTLEFQEKNEKGTFQRTELTGKYLEDVALGYSGLEGKPLILLQFNEEGSKILEALTKRNEGKEIGIFIDGIPTLPLKIKKAISGGRVQIEMEAEIESVRELAKMMQVASLSPHLKLVSKKTISKEKAQGDFKTLKESFFLGIILISLILIGVYKMAGVISTIILLIYGFLFLILAKMIPIVVSFSSVLGFLFSVGIFLFGNVYILSKLREVIKEKEIFGIAVEKAFQRSLPLIRKIGFFLLILMGILYLIGTDSIKQLVFTFSIGVLIYLSFITYLLYKIFLSFEDTRLKDKKWLWI